NTSSEPGSTSWVDYVGEVRAARPDECRYAAAIHVDAPDRLRLGPGCREASARTRQPREPRRPRTYTPHGAPGYVAAPGPGCGRPGVRVVVRVGRGDPGCGHGEEGGRRDRGPGPPEEGPCGLAHGGSCSLGNGPGLRGRAHLTTCTAATYAYLPLEVDRLVPATLITKE